MDNANVDQIRYSLAKQVPDMSRGFLISTNYGDIQIHQHEAELVIKAVKQILEKRLKLATK